MTKNQPFTTITIRTFGGPVELTGRILERFAHGFNTEGGGWGLNDISHLGYPCTPAEWVLFREKGKRNPIKINVNRVISGLPSTSPETAQSRDTTPRLEDLIFDKVPVPEIATALGVSLSTAYRRRRLMPGYQHKSVTLKRRLTQLSKAGKSPAEMAKATGYKEVWIKMRLLEWGLRPKVKDKGATVDPAMVESCVESGMTPKEMRAALGCSKSTLYRKLKDSPVYKARLAYNGYR